MKNRGLKNRFNREKLAGVWTYNYKCFWCNYSGGDLIFHHIISPSSYSYVQGEHNKSMLNSCPIHNHNCHLYNGLLHKERVEKKLLKRVLRTLLRSGYNLTEKDVDFYKAYKELYKD